MEYSIYCIYVCMNIWLFCCICVCLTLIYFPPPVWPLSPRYAPCTHSISNFQTCNHMPPWYWIDVAQIIISLGIVGPPPLYAAHECICDIVLNDMPCPYANYFINDGYDSYAPWYAHAILCPPVLMPICLPMPYWNAFHAMPMINVYLYICASYLYYQWMSIIWYYMYMMYYAYDVSP